MHAPLPPRGTASEQPADPQRLWQHIELWLTAIRDAFILLMPLTFLGLLAVLLQHLPWQGYQQGMERLWGTAWWMNLGVIVRATHGVFGVALATVIAVMLALRYQARSPTEMDVPPAIVGSAALINFMLFIFSQPYVDERLGHGAMLLGIVVGIASAELLRGLMRCRWLNLSAMLYDTGALYYYAMRMSLPVIVSGLIVFAFIQFTAALPPLPRHALQPLVVWAQSQGDAVWLLSLVATGLNQVFWFLGLSGAQVVQHYGADLFAPAGAAYTHELLWRPLFNHYTLLGGAGATFGLVIAILLTVKNGPQRRVAQVSAVPALFNINEAILYGLPIVLNTAYLIPFLGVPLVLTLLTVGAAQAGWVVFLPITLPWTTPPLISGWLLTGSWHGAALQAVLIGLSAALYLPFVRRAEAARQRHEAAVFADAVQAIQTEGPLRGRLMLRHDPLGFIAWRLLADLRAGLRHNNGELSLAYQPKHDRAGRVVGVEALLRWWHPHRGPIPSAVTVRLAEDTLDIHPLGVWVIREACACKARWNQLGYRGLTMGINLSPLQLTDPSLPATIQQAIEQNGLQPWEIELEITESAVIPDGRIVDQTLQRLVTLGVRLSMDDFGMGHSSLLYLRRFPVHAIKIDGSLTQEVLHNSTNADIVRTIATLGQAQHADVVAEYVETQAQRELLAQLGCTLFQGYFHSAALPEAQCLPYFIEHGTHTAATQAGAALHL
mgnify:CR=1 FL=1